MSDTTKKIGQNIIFTVKVAFFFLKNLCFQQPLWSFESVLIGSSEIVKTTLRPYYKVSWGFPHSIKGGTMGQKLLSSWKLLFFETFVSIDLFGHKDMVLSNAQSLSKYLVDTYKYSSAFVLLVKTRKKRLKSFLHWKDWLFFFQKFVLSTAS